jgi:MFS family permease
MTGALYLKINGRLYYGWVIVGVCFLSWLVADAFGFYTFGLYIVPINKELGWSSITITGALTVKMLTSAVIGPFIGYLTDKKYGARVLMTGGVLVAGATTFLIGYVQHSWQFYLLYGIIGSLGVIGFGGMVTHTLIAKWFIRMRGRAMGIATVGVSISGLIFIPITQYMIANHGWRNSLKVVGALIWLTAFLPSLIFIRRCPEDLGLLPDGDKYPQISGPDEKQFSRIERGKTKYNFTLRQAIRTKALWITLAALNITGISLNGIMTHFYPYMKDKGIPTHIAAASMTVFAACCALVKIPWGLLAEKFPVRYSVIAVYIGGAIALFILLKGNSSTSVFLYAIIYGISLGGNMVLREILFADYFGHEYLGAIRGAIMPINVLSMAASPILAAWLYETTGAYEIPYTLFLCTFIAGSGIMYFAKPPKPPEE